MATNLAIDDKLLSRALKIGGKRTKKDTVNEALREFIVKREQKKVLDIFGTVEYFDDYDPRGADDSGLTVVYDLDDHRVYVWRTMF